MSYDNVCKNLTEKYPEDFAEWLLGSSKENVQVLKTELSREPIDSDSAILLSVDQAILHIEFQTVPGSEPPLPLRMADYFIGLYRKYRLPVHQFIIFLKETTSDLVFTNEFKCLGMTHQYNVIRIWETDPARLMTTPGLLALAVLVRSETPEMLLTQVVRQAQAIESIEERKNTLTTIEVLAGLKFPTELVEQLIKEDTVQESVTYQKILKKGEQIGRQLGFQEGLVFAEQRALQQETELIIRQLRRRVGPLKPLIIARIKALPIASLEQLGEDLLDFHSLADLETWLTNMESD